MFNHQSMILHNYLNSLQFSQFNHLPLKKRAVKIEKLKDQIKTEISDCSYLSSFSATSSPVSSDTCSFDSGFYEDEPLDLSLNPASLVDNSISNSDQIFKFQAKHSTPNLKLSPSANSEFATKLICPNCNKTYDSNARFRAHIRRHESKLSGRYQCKVCLKNFVQRSSLRTHERIHTGEKPYHCLVCNERFGDFSTFTKHRRTHTGEKPYSCPVCKRSFSQSGNMHRHLKVVHRPTLMDQL